MGNVNDRPDDVEYEDASDATPRREQWVSVYGSLHRYVRRRTAVFGGTAVVGAVALARWLAALAVDSSVSGLLSAVGGVGALLFGFGGGYYVVRRTSRCGECGVPFSREQVDKRPIRREVRGRDRTYVEVTVECRHCGHRTTDTYGQPEPFYPRN